jgi:hypothetical protein
MLDQEETQLAWQGIILCEKCQQGIRRVEPANNHDDQRLHDEPIRRRFGPPARPLGWLGWPRELIDEHDQADKQTRVV